VAIVGCGVTGAVAAVHLAKAAAPLPVRVTVFDIGKGYPGELLGVSILAAQFFAWMASCRNTGH
jgi:glycine/D-amino acid oxidase-like deaminating enzyme